MTKPNGEPMTPMTVSVTIDVSVRINGQLVKLPTLNPQMRAQALTVCCANLAQIAEVPVSTVAHSAIAAIEATAQRPQPKPPRLVRPTPGDVAAVKKPS